MENESQLRNFIHYLIYFYAERISFTRLSKCEQIYMVAIALIDELFNDVEIYSINKNDLSVAILGNVSPEVFLDSIKLTLLREYELYLDEKIEDEYDRLGYNAQKAPEVDFERELLAQELNQNGNNAQQWFKYAMGEL